MGKCCGTANPEFHFCIFKHTVDTRGPERSPRKVCKQSSRIRSDASSRLSILTFYLAVNRFRTATITNPNADEQPISGPNHIIICVNGLLRQWECQRIEPGHFRLLEVHNSSDRRVCQTNHTHSLSKACNCRIICTQTNKNFLGFAVEEDTKHDKEVAPRECHRRGTAVRRRGGLLKWRFPSLLRQVPKWRPIASIFEQIRAVKIRFQAAKI